MAEFGVFFNMVFKILLLHNDCMFYVGYVRIALSRELIFHNGNRV